MCVKTHKNARHRKPCIPLLSVARGHPPPHCENTQVLREAITESEDDDDDDSINI